MEVVCRAHLGKKTVLKQGECCQQTKWFAERSCLYTHSTEDSVHTAVRSPIQSTHNDSWVVQTHPKVLCPFTRRQGTQTVPNIQDNHTRGPYLVDLSMESASLDAWPLQVLNKVCEQNLLSRRQRKLNIHFSAIQKSQGNRYPARIFVKKTPSP